MGETEKKRKNWEKPSIENPIWIEYTFVRRHLRVMLLLFFQFIWSTDIDIFVVSFVAQTATVCSL